MANVQEHISKFANYPGPREAPDVPWGPDPAKNPIFRGAVSMSLVQGKWCMLVVSLV